MPAGAVATRRGHVSRHGDRGRSDETTPVHVHRPDVRARRTATTRSRPRCTRIQRTSTDLRFDLTLEGDLRLRPGRDARRADRGSTRHSSPTTFSGPLHQRRRHGHGRRGREQPALLLDAVREQRAGPSAAPLADGGYTVLGVADRRPRVTGASTESTSWSTPGPGRRRSPRPTGGVALAAGTHADAHGHCSTGRRHGAASRSPAPASASLNAPLLERHVGRPRAPGPADRRVHGGRDRRRNAAGTTGTSAAQHFSVDTTAPVTTNNTASIGNAWRTTAADRSPSPRPTPGPGRGAHVLHDRRLDADDRVGRRARRSCSTATACTRSSTSRSTRLGNAEAVKTAATQIRIDTAAPVTTDNTASFSSWTTRT